MRGSLQEHWPEYLMEALGLGLFMLAACAFGVLLEHPQSAARQAIDNAAARRAVMGLAMGLTAVGLIHSPWGKRSGAQLNPAVTLTFWRLGKVRTPDAVGYAIAQCAGGFLGVQLARVLLGARVAAPEVNWAATIPGPGGPGVAFAAELTISLVMMLTVLTVSNSRRSAWTGYCAGLLVALFIALESPLSGMSMNPARTLASGLSAGMWPSLWLYLTAPVAGMLLSAELHTRVARARVHCAKLRHDNHSRCIFRCAFGDLIRLRAAPAPHPGAESQEVRS